MVLLPFRTVLPQTENGLVLYLTGNAGAGRVMHDCSPMGNNGRIYGATWTDGKFGKALSFDGVDDYVDCGNDESLQMTDEVTLMAWIKTTYDGGAHTVVARNYGFMINAPFGSNIEFYGHDGSDATKCTPSWLSEYDDKWIFVAAVIRKYTGSWTIRGFVNGVKVCESTNSAFDGPGQLGKVTIGSLLGTPRFFNGTIDEVRIYNRALSEEEIRAHFKGAVIKLKAGLSAPVRIRGAMILRKPVR